MAHTKSQGAVKGNRDSISKRLGVKKYAGQTVNPGNIIVRQRGSKINSGKGTLMGKDFTVFANMAGIVSFRTLRGKKLVEVNQK